MQVFPRLVIGTPIEINLDSGRVYRLDRREGKTEVLHHIPNAAALEDVGCDWSRIRKMGTTLSRSDYRIGEPYAGDDLRC